MSEWSVLFTEMEKQTDEQSWEGETAKTHLSRLSLRCLLDILWRPEKAAGDVGLEFREDTKDRYLQFEVNSTQTAFKVVGMPTIT